MKRFTTTWITAAAAAALLTMPASGMAQTPPTSTPPATAQPPATPPADPTAAQPAPQAAQTDEAAARGHLTEARNTLSALTQLPAAAQLTGEARTQVSQLISNFNELITTQAEWRDAYAKVSANLTALLGPDPTAGTSGTAGAVGTSGTATATIDPAVREKLVELRMHLSAFEKAAGGGGATAATPATPATPPTDPATPPDATKPPAATPATPTTPATPPAESTPQSTTGTTDLMRHVTAIEALLNMQDDSGGLTLTKTQVEELRSHWAALRLALEKK
jgi:hypothetical protein